MKSKRITDPLYLELRVGGIPDQVYSKTLKCNTEELWVRIRRRATPNTFIQQLRVIDRGVVSEGNERRAAAPRRVRRVAALKSLLATDSA